MNGIPFAYWGAGNCTDFMPATSSLMVYYNVNQPSCYTIGSTVLNNIAPNFTQYTGSTTAQYDTTLSALDCRSTSISATYPFNMYGDSVGKTIMFRAKLDPASEQYFLFRNTANQDEGARAFSANNFNGGGLGFQRGVYDCRTVLPTSSIANFNSDFVTIAIQTNGSGLGAYFIPDNNYTTAYSVSSAPISCTTINDYDVIMENAGYMQSWAVWNKQLTTLEMQSASIALACNALYDPFINPQEDSLIQNGLSVYLSTDSFTGSVWYDKSGNGNNATMYGASTNAISGGIYFNGSAYSSNSSNYLQFPNPLVLSPTASATIILFGQFDTNTGRNNYLFRKGWEINGEASGSLGWDDVLTPTDINFRVQSPLDSLITSNYTSGSNEILALTLKSGSNASGVNNLNYYRVYSYLPPEGNDISWGGANTVVFNGSGSASAVPLTLGKGDYLNSNCSIYGLKASTGNTRYYDYIDANGVTQNVGVGGSNQIFVNTYPGTFPYKQGDNQGNNLAPDINFISATGGVTASIAPTFFPMFPYGGVDAYPLKGQINNILIYNRELTAPEIYRTYNYLIANTTNINGSIPTSPLPTTYTNYPLTDSLALWNAKTSLSGSVWYDISGNNNTATLYGNSVSLSGSLGYAFDGSTNYVGWQNNITQNNLLLSGSKWTMQFYGSLYNDNITRELFNKGNNTSGWQLRWIPTANPTGSSFNMDSRQLRYNYTGSAKVLVTVTNDTEGTGSTKLYVNQNFITASNGATNFYTNNTWGMAFGKVSLGATTEVPFKGTVSDLLLYNKVLSATEVSQSFAYLSTL